MFGAFLEQDEKWEQMPGCLSRSGIQQLLTSLAPPAICWPGLSPTDMLASRKTKIHSDIASLCI